MALYLENLREGLTEGGGLDELLDAAFWQKLDDRQQQALLRLCLFDQLSQPMLNTLVPNDLLSQEALVKLLHSAPLMLYRETRKTYYPHELLIAFLRRRLVEMDADFRGEVLRSSAEVFSANGMTKEAVGCYYRAEDYEAILAC